MPDTLASCFVHGDFDAALDRCPECARGPEVCANCDHPYRLHPRGEACCHEFVTGSDNYCTCEQFHTQEKQA